MINFEFQAHWHCDVVLRNNTMRIEIISVKILVFCIVFNETVNKLCETRIVPMKLKIVV